MASRRIGLLLQMVHEMSRGGVRGVASYVRAHADWELVLVPWSAHDRPDIARLGVDGIIAHCFDADVAPRMLAAAGLPTVCLTHPGPLLRVPVVTIDDRAIGAQAVRFFRERGYGAVAFYGMPRQPWSRDKIEGMRAEADGAAIEVGPDTSGRPWPDRVAAVGAWLATLSRPYALLCDGSFCAHVALSAARAQGMAVPEDLALLASDDEQGYADICDPPLALVDTPRERLGWEAARLLDAWLRGEPPPMSTEAVPPSGIIVRRSADHFAVGDAHLAQALRIIAREHHRPLRLDALALRLGMSRRSLERRFRDHLGRSFLDELARVRLEHARRLLAGGETVGVVARRVGFSGAEPFIRAFGRAFGETPGRFRGRSAPEA